MSSSSHQPTGTQLDHLAARYEGSGHADMTRHEWAVQQHRDSIASYLGHSSMVEYFAMAEGISVARARLNLFERMHRPVGEAPAGEMVGEGAGKGHAKTTTKAKVKASGSWATNGVEASKGGSNGADVAME